MNGIKVLFVDDSALVIRFVADLLSSHGRLEVKTAGSLSEGLEAFLGDAPRVLLVDFVLEGGRTGLELVSAVFSLSAPRPATAILTAGDLSAADKARADSLGVKVLQKPRLGQEREFLREIEIWLHAQGVL